MILHAVYVPNTPFLIQSLFNCPILTCRLMQRTLIWPGSLSSHRPRACNAPCSQERCCTSLRGAGTMWGHWMWASLSASGGTDVTHSTGRTLCIYYQCMLYPPWTWAKPTPLHACLQETDLIDQMYLCMHMYRSAKTWIMKGTWGNTAVWRLYVAECMLVS